jgi:hypothetical protein
MYQQLRRGIAPASAVMLWKLQPRYRATRCDDDTPPAKKLCIRAQVAEHSTRDNRIWVHNITHSVDNITDHASDDYGITDFVDNITAHGSDVYDIAHSVDNITDHASDVYDITHSVDNITDHASDIYDVTGTSESVLAADQQFRTSASSISSSAPPLCSLLVLMLLHQQSRTSASMDLLEKMTMGEMHDSEMEYEDEEYEQKNY